MSSQRPQDIPPILRLETGPDRSPTAQLDGRTGQQDSYLVITERTSE
ncbi:hypothetical protein [Nocardia australiensis]|nr:hypothetical protein [Nocardia australiensis]